MNSGENLVITWRRLSSLFSAAAWSLTERKRSAAPEAARRQMGENDARPEARHDIRLFSSRADSRHSCHRRARPRRLAGGPSRRSGLAVVLSKIGQARLGDYEESEILLDNGNEIVHYVFSAANGRRVGCAGHSCGGPSASQQIRPRQARIGMDEDKRAGGKGQVG
jgi:hypothetical protein